MNISVESNIQRFVIENIPIFFPTLSDKTTLVGMAFFDSLG